jgi:hypothetical protein
VCRDAEEEGVGRENEGEKAEEEEKAGKERGRTKNKREGGGNDENIKRRLETGKMEAGG